MHASFYVKDLEATIGFYNQFFGQQPEKVKAGYVKYLLESPALVISFIENPQRVQSHFGHLGFQVATKAEMEERLAISKSLGMVDREEMGTSCCYAVQDKFWAVDPDGIQWEVYYFHEDAEFNDPRYESQEASACCGLPPEKPKVRLSEVIKKEAVVCEPGGGCC